LGEVFVWLAGRPGCRSEGSTSLRDRRAATSTLCLLRRLTFPAVSAEEDEPKIAGFNGVSEGPISGEAVKKLWQESPRLPVFS